MVAIVSACEIGALARAVARGEKVAGEQADKGVLPGEGTGIYGLLGSVGVRLSEGPGAMSVFGSDVTLRKGRLWWHMVEVR